MSKTARKASCLIRLISLCLVDLFACRQTFEFLGIIHTVTYDGNGATAGSAPIDDLPYAQGQTVMVLGNTGSLEKTGQDFAGWNSRADGKGSSYNAGDNFTMGNSNVTLYALWTATVTYNANGATAGSVPTDTSTYIQGQTVTVLGNSGGLEKPPYVFAGWNTQADGNGTTYDAGQGFTMGGCHVILFAKWLLVYAVTYNANGATAGTVPTDSTEYQQGQTVTVLSNSGGLAKPPYAFSGWNTQADGNGTMYNVGQGFSMGSSDMTLYVKWGPKISTVAGTGSSGYSGDGGPATSARLYRPCGVAVDTAGNLFFADTSNCRVRKIDTSGIITTVAGTGSSGYSGDGGAAISAQLSYPMGVAIDTVGNLFFADVNNRRIRKIDISGIITTVAGTGSGGYSGDGGPATSAQISYSYYVAVDAVGNLLFADNNNCRIRKVDTNGIITTVAGTGSSGYSGDGELAISAQLNYPLGVAVDAAGNLYIADWYNYRIRKVDTSGIITTVAGTGSSGYSGDGGAATSAQLSYPSGVAVGTAGNVFFADESYCCVRKVDTSGIITTLAGNGSYGYSGDGGAATSAQLRRPCGVAVDTAGNLFIGDQDNHRIRKVSPL